MRRTLFLIILLTFFIGTASAATVTVGFSGDNADYTCDGSRDDVQINAALAKVAGTGGTVYLKSGTYDIGQTLRIGDSTTLTGSSNAVLRIENNARWGEFSPVIKNSGSKGNIKIHGFEIDGNYANNDEHQKGIGAYYILMRFSDISNVEVYDMYLHDNSFDLMRFSSCTDISIHDNVGRNQGHEFVWFMKCNRVEVYNNDMSIWINSGVRVETTNNIKIHHNKITAPVYTGYAGIYVRSFDKRYPMTSVKIYNNEISNTMYAGIYVTAYKAGNVLDDKSLSTGLHIYNNVITNTGRKSKAPGGGISSAGFHNTIIENNVIKNVKGDGISILYTEPELSYTGVTYYIRDNTITSPSGYTIKNYETSTHKIVTSGSSSSSTEEPTSSSSDTSSTTSSTTSSDGKPVASITSINPSPATVGSSVSFAGSGSDDGTIVRYTWKSSIDDILWTSTSSASFSTSKLSAGTHTIKLYVKDNDGQWSSAATSTLVVGTGSSSSTSTTSTDSSSTSSTSSTTSTSSDGKPVASITSINPSPATVGSSVSFAGSGSDDGTIIRYTWKSSIDDLLWTSTSSASFSTSKLSAGTHTIKLYVKDNDGQWSSAATSTLVVGTSSTSTGSTSTDSSSDTSSTPSSDGKPVASITSINPSPATVGSSVSFAGSGSDDGTIVRYTWKSSIDDILWTSTSSASFSTSKLSAGTHTIKLYVKDNDGQWSSAATSTLVVGTGSSSSTSTTSTDSNIRPTASIISVSPSPVTVGSSVSFKGSGSDADGTITTYAWKSSRDGLLWTSSSSASFSTSKLSAGTHTILFLVKDNDGRWTGTTTTLVVKS